MNENPVLGLAAEKLNAGELPPKEGGADKAAFAFRPSAAGFAPNMFGGIPDAWFCVAALLFDWPKTNGALAVVFVLGLPKIPCDVVLAGVCVAF